MNIRHLPYDTTLQAAPDPHGVRLSRHHTAVPQERVPVSLHGNMALFVLHGHVQIQAPTATVGVDEGGLILAAAGNYLFTEMPVAGHYEALQLYFGNEPLTDCFIKYHGYLPGVEPAVRRPLLAYAGNEFLHTYARSLTQLAVDGSQPTPAKLEALLRHLLQEDAAWLRSWQIVAEQD